MVREYTPDRWIIVELSGKKVPETYRRILAGWSGGYLHGQSWKLSSGIESIIDRDTHWEILNTSGSIYKCHKGSEGLNMTTAGILDSYAKQNDEDFTMMRISIDPEEVVADTEKPKKPPRTRR